MTDHVRAHDFPMGDADAFADALNAALDGDAPVNARDVDALTPLLATLRAVQKTPLADGEVLSARQRDDLWAAIVGDATPRTAPIPVVSHAPGFQATYPLRNRLVAGRTRPGQGERSSGHPVWRTIGSWVSMALIAAMLLAMGSMVWSLRPGADGDRSLLASATSLAMGTALASPPPVATEGDGWMRWPVPEDCNVAPMAHEDYARIMSTQPDISGRSYEVAGTPSEGEAVVAADAARRHFACEAFSLAAEERTLSSSAFTFFKSWSTARTLTDADLATAGLIHGMDLSATIGPKAPKDYLGYPEGTPAIAEMVLWPLTEWSTQLPDDVQAVMALTFDPVNAVQLGDGRIAFPATMLGFMLDGHEVTQEGLARFGTELPSLDVVAPPLYVMANQGGQWVVDEVLVYCPYSGCGPVWESLAKEAGVPMPVLNIPVPWTTPTGTATPVASPVSALSRIPG